MRSWANAVTRGEGNTVLVKKKEDEAARWKGRATAERSGGGESVRTQEKAGKDIRSAGNTNRGRECEGKYKTGLGSLKALTKAASVMEGVKVSRMDSCKN